MLPKQGRGTYRKHMTKPSEQVAAPPSRVWCAQGCRVRLIDPRLRGWRVNTKTVHPCTRHAHPYARLGKSLVLKWLSNRFTEPENHAFAQLYAGWFIWSLTVFWTYKLCLSIIVSISRDGHKGELQVAWCCVLLPLAVGEFSRNLELPFLTISAQILLKFLFQVNKEVSSTRRAAL